MNYPPTKRLRSMNHEVVTNFDDPFGNDEDFSQADLDEIDIIASQAITSATTGGAGQGSRSGGQNRPLSRAAVDQNQVHRIGLNSKSNSGMPSREPIVNRQQFSSDKSDYSVLEAQHAELKRKLKEVEEEILLKSGEIRVLRDSLKAAQQEKEVQRQNQVLAETQRLKEQSEKEKELNRKVQSLQSELQFKEAEINEMKSKLHSSTSPLPRNSPKVLNSITQLHHGSSSSSSSSPSGSGFITKEMFGAQVVTRTTPVKTSSKLRREGGSRSADRLEVSHPDPFLSVRRPNLQHRGGALLGLLLQQPLFPSSLGLSHLLSLNLTDTHRTSRLSAAAASNSDIIINGGRASGVALSPVQNLAVTGLNLLSQSNRSSSSCSSCPGSILLLPLLQLHLSQLCHSLDSTVHSTTTGSIPTYHSTSSGLDRLEDAGQTRFSMEDSGLAALRILHLLLMHSDEVVKEVLMEGSQSKVADKKVEATAANVDPKSQNSLLQCVLRLCDTGVSPKEELICNAMKTLHVLVDRTPNTNTDKLESVLEQVCVCVSTDNRLGIISQCMSILSSMSDHERLIRHLGSQYDLCVFLKLFQFIRSRPDQKACHTDWILLDLQVIRLMSKVLMQRAESWINEHGTCQCHTEFVQTVVIVFHRQWLDLRDSSDLTPPPGSTPSSSPWWRGPAASLLRECLLLLHWLLLHHRRFFDSCRPLLHMYDQVIPAVRDTLKRIPGLSESEELALEEICRSDGDDGDDMDTEPSS